MSLTAFLSLLSGSCCFVESEDGGKDGKGRQRIIIVTSVTQLVKDNTAIKVYTKTGSVFWLH